MKNAVLMALAIFSTLSIIAFASHESSIPTLTGNFLNELLNFLTQSGCLPDMECDTNRWGGDLYNVYQPSAEDCRIECEGNNACKAWTWVKDTGDCWIKGAAVTASWDSC